jgi:hypothetical protein
MSDSEFSQVHADAISAMLKQLLIVLIDRAGGETAISAGEVDATGDRNLTMRVEQDWFYFTVVKKAASAPRYHEH